MRSRSTDLLRSERFKEPTLVSKVADESQAENQTSEFQRIAIGT